MPENKQKQLSVEEKLRRTKMTVDRNLEERARRRKVPVEVPVAGARGTTPLRGDLSFDQLKAGGYIKQRQKDLFTVRCRCPGGRVPAAWLRAVADACEHYGKGYVHLSFRQSLEVPYVSYEDFPSVTDLLAQAGVNVATCGPRVRVPTACSGCEYNPNGLTDTQAMAKLVDQEFFGEEYYHKFKISFSGCPIDCARTNEMDLAFQGAAYPLWDEATCTGCTICSKACLEGAIVPDPESGAPQFEPSKCLYCADCIRACPTESWSAGSVGWIVRIGGRHGRHPHNGTVVARLISDEKVVSVIRTVLDWYGEHGKEHGRTRIGELLKAPGAMKSMLDSLETVVGPSLVREAPPPEPVVIHRYPDYEPSWLRDTGAAPRQGQQRFVINRTVDVTGLTCPLPFAKNKLALDAMEAGQKLEILVDGTEVGTLSKSIKADGHRIIGTDAFDDDRFRLVVERGSL
ncbi:MAG: 4Fe-4S dicluster domain-containing protein [Candidatus Glassbacteria bacterium]|nr:4Fe-4S dicluster domain-containing protein [Candidatus Glassbacteria bacterium]